MLATAITASLPNPNSATTSPPDAFALTRNGNCFNCGKPGHFKNQCRKPGGGAAFRGQTRGPPSSSKPKTICPRCRKGYHWASNCYYNPSPSQPSGN
uniref:CCHC-type domain-containing protein n=1 Tax=Pseudonaja textilis TaxID=8673 RepID=A0A670ZNI3_PSETE